MSTQSVKRKPTPSMLICDDIGFNSSKISAKNCCPCKKQKHNKFERINVNSGFYEEPYGIEYDQKR